MKKALILLLALLTVLGGCALAETAENNPLAEYALTSGVPVEIDLNGDGTIETLTYTAETDETLGGEFARIEIGTAQGTTVGWNTQTLFMTSAYAVDIDGTAPSRCSSAATGRRPTTRPTACTISITATTARSSCSPSPTPTAAMKTRGTTSTATATSSPSTATSWCSAARRTCSALIFRNADVCAGGRRV